MVDEASANGLVIDPVRRAEVAPPISPTDPKPWNAEAHESLTPAWWIGEFVPKQHWDDKTRSYNLRMNLFRRREIKDGELVHEATLFRIRERNPKYEPPNLTPSFIEKVRAMPAVTGPIPYESGQPST
jgi:hypothetical protein